MLKGVGYIDEGGKMYFEPKNRHLLVLPIETEEKEFAVNVAIGKTAVKSYMEAFNENDSNKAKKKAVILLKQERVMKEIERSVGDVADQLWIDHEFILSRLKYLVENSDDENISLQSLKELGKAIGTLGNVTKKVDTGVLGIFQGFSPEQIEGAKREVLTDGGK